MIDTAQDSPNYVVAYEATRRGAEAIELGVALARLTGAELHVCLVLPEVTTVPSKIASSAANYATFLERQAEEWLTEALRSVPPDVTATTHLVWSETVSEGLLDAVERFNSDRIVIGAARGGLLGRFSIGSVANALLHASPVPVALAPRGYRALPGITRITCAIGTRSGWQPLLDSMIAIADELSVDLRFVTLVEVDAARARTEPEDDAATAHLHAVLDYFSAHARATGRISTEVGTGQGIEAAVEALDWQPGEIAFVGSSRLASPNRIFLGATANRMLRSLPVPLVVVPVESGFHHASTLETD